MKYTHMGRGTMNFGPASGERQSLRILSGALEGGINLVDTADVYGWELGQGITEKIEKRKKQIRAYEALCRDLGEKPSVVALAWLLHQPDVSAPLIGPRTMEQLEESLRALEFDLDRETLESLDSIWPGPGQAPEAYTW